MHITYYTDTTTIAGNENARYHTEIHRFCASTVFVQVITRVGRIYCTQYDCNILYNVYYTLYNCIGHIAH